MVHLATPGAEQGEAESSKRICGFIPFSLQTSVTFSKVHSLHSWGKHLRFLVICCRHLKPDLCSALSSYLPAYPAGRVKCLRIRLSAAMAAPALLTGNASACPSRLFVPQPGKPSEGANPEGALLAQPDKPRVCPRCSARRLATLRKRGARIPREAPGPPHPLAAGLHLYFRMKRSKRNSGSAFKHLSKSLCWAGVVQPSLPPPAATNST